MHFVMNTDRKKDIPLGTAEEFAEVAKLQRLARIMDSAIVIPGTEIRIGWDPVIGLIPGFGDAASAIVSCYIVLKSAKLGAPPIILLRMLINIIIDALLGIVPFIGDLFDVAWKANVRNVDLLERAISARQLSPRSIQETGKLFRIFLISLTALIVGGCAFLGIALVVAILRAFR